MSREIFWESQMFRALQQIFQLRQPETMIAIGVLAGTLLHDAARELLDKFLPEMWRKLREAKKQDA